MKYLLIAISFLFLISCNTKENEKITNRADYDQFLVSETPKTTSKYFNLWNSKIKPDSIQLTSFGIVAGEYESYFKATGEIAYLKKSEQALEKAVEIAATGRAGYRRSLARNYISQHRFKDALVQAEIALELGAGLKETQSLLFDIYMELGNYELAKTYLDSIIDLSSFGYLIRTAKWNDHQGDLASTINYMEQAKKKAENGNSKQLVLWVYTNLADYYGHAGRIKDSYAYYLKSLALDHQNAYAKKGIAWIVFSHEKNPKEALRILDSVTKNHDSPDYYLLKAEIASYMGDQEAHNIYLDDYLMRVKDPKYGDMYNTYNIDLYLNKTDQLAKALELAHREVANRPTPESYNFLAYSYLKIGEKQKALEIIEKHIEGKTFEPSIWLNAAEIYKANGNETIAKALKKELLGALYELGPDKKDKIESL